MTSLAVVDPAPLHRIGLAALVGAIGFDPVQEAAELDDLMRLDGGDRPDLMLISMRTAPEIAPLVHEIRAWAPATKLVFLAPTLDMRGLIACFAAGAQGYLLETLSREGLQHSLRLVGAGGNVFPSELADALRGMDIPRPLGAGESRQRRKMRRFGGGRPRRDPAHPAKA